MFIILDAKKHLYSHLVVTKTNQNGRVLSTLERKFKCKTSSYYSLLSKTENYFNDNVLDQRGLETDKEISETDEMIIKEFTTKKLSRSGEPLRTIYHVMLAVYKRQSFLEQDQLVTLK